MIMQLYCHDAEIFGGRIRDNIRKVAVEGNEYRLQFLSFCDGCRIGGSNRKDFTQTSHLVAM